MPTSGNIRGFAKRRIAEIAGLLMLGACLFVITSLITHSTSDPSFNTASSGRINNAGGLVGAYLADLLLQITGLATIVIISSLTTWGVLLLRKHRLKRVWLRFSSMILAMPFIAAILALIPAPSSWPFPVGFGGFIGDFLQKILLSALTLPVYLPLFFTFAILFFTMALGLTWWQWKQIIGTIFNYFAKIIKSASKLFRALFEKIDYEDDDYIPESSAKRIKKEDLRKEKLAKVSRNKPEVILADSGEDLPTTPPPKTAIKPIAKQMQTSFKLGRNVIAFELPPMNLLSVPNKRDRKSSFNENSLSQNARLLESVLEDFGVNGKITKVRPGPVVTLYELEPSPGTKSSRVIGLADDIARSMSAISARISVIPGKNALGIELPNANRETVYLRELLESPAYRNHEAKLALALGKDIGGESMIVDLAKMPHLLVAGTTGSGKSVGVNGMILSLLYRLTPEQCKFIMIDPKMLELSIYDGIPHLLSPVVTEPGKAVVALKWTVKEMENRYRLMSTLGVRNIGGYNKRIEEAIERGERITRSVQTGFDPDTGKPIVEEIPLEMQPLPYIVVVVDEMADLMLVAGKDIESSIQRLAQMARAAGIHLIMATQRPSVDVITGVIKANFPTRISFQVTSKIDSRTILGEQGAEQLLGQGDMLYMAGGGRITRIHGPFVADKEVEDIVNHLKAQGEPEYVEEVTTADEEVDENSSSDSEGGDLYRQAVQIVTNEGKASTSYIQRRLKIGYNRAANLIEQMEREGIISAPNHAGKREVLSGR